MTTDASDTNPSDASDRLAAAISRRRFGQTAAAVAAAACLPSPRPTAAAVSPRLAASQWWAWRGPTRNNHAPAGSRVPDAITPEAAAWTADVPGRGHSSPVVVGDFVYLTTADKAKGTQGVLCYTRDGQPAWSRVAHTGGIPQNNHYKNTEASPTVACDGEAIYAAFYNDGAIRVSKLSLDGEPVWQVAAGRYRPRQYEYGYAASPQVHGETLLVVGDYDGESFLTALSLADGREVWRTKRQNATSFSSPIVARVAGREQILLSGGNQVAGYDPETGRRLWANPNASTMATCGTMVWLGDLAFASGGYPRSHTVAVNAAGGGDLVWDNSDKCYEQSMLIVGEHLYGVTDNGVGFCRDAATGRTRWKERLGGRFSSSPLLVGDRIHVFNESGRGFCFAADPEGYRELAQSKIGDDVFATPAVVDNVMYLRVGVGQGEARRERLVAVS